VVDSCGERAASAQYPEVVKSTVRSLLSHLRVFAAFQDLKSVHRQAELREKVESLLTHRLNQVIHVFIIIIEQGLLYAQFRIFVCPWYGTYCGRHVNVFMIN
jgi:hypothetical protein